MEGAEGGGRGGVSLDAALVKEPECATVTFHVTIKEEVRPTDEVLVKEEPECASSAACASGTGAGACAGAARVGGDELELAPARVQHKPYICGVSRAAVSDGEAWLKRAGGSHRRRAGTAGAGHDTAQHDTITDTLQHTAQTHTYKCDTCSQIFIQKQCLIKHVKVHLREASETLPNESLFILEPGQPSDTSVKKYSCKICKKKFRKNYLKIHVRFHTGEKPYTCDVCKKQFAVLGSLREHKRIHTEERPYSCNLCAKSYARSSYLKTHKLSHTNEKPYECQICKKRFAQTSNLKSHVRTHTGEKPYGCTICKKRFTQWSALETHKRTHEGAKPYSCEICKKKFTQFGNLKTHKRIHLAKRGAQDEGHVTKDELVLGRRHTQRPKTVKALGKKSWRSVVRECGPALDRCAVTAHRRPAGTAGAGHETVQQNTTDDTLQHTAETNSYKCDTCGQIFLQKQCLIDHVKVQHREASDTLSNESLFIFDPSETSVKKYTCRICNKKFRKDYLKIHERFHTGEKPYTCEVCKKQFAVLGNLRQHKRIHTEEKGTQGELYTHVTKDELLLGPRHSQRPNTVNALCEKSRSLVRDYGAALDQCAVTNHREPAGTRGAEHETVQHTTDTLQHTAETNTYKCDTCGQIFLQKHYLIDHVKVHLREASEILPNESLFIFESSDTNTSVKKYSCKICKKKFRKNYLKLHERIHTGEKPYVCEVCKKEFAVLGNLRDHKRKHTEERPYSCGECGKIFARSDHLKTHERSHTGEKPYKCETCKKGFSQLTNLQSHIRTHTGEKPYPCTMCDKQFTQWSALNNHKRSHTGEKTYPCDISKNKFKHLATLNVPKIIHTIEKPFSCKTCKKTFRKKSSFVKHKHEAFSVKEKSESQSSTDPCGASETHKEIRVKEEPECESSVDPCEASETHKETRVKEEPECESSVDPCGASEMQAKEEPKCQSSADTCKVSETGASVDHVIKIELELEPEGVQRRDRTVASRAVSPRCELLATTSGASGAQQPAPPRDTNMTHDALRATTAGTHVMKQNNLTTDKQTTSKRPYTCDICKKTFTQSGSLNTHKRIHTGEKPYTCELCNKTFTALATLNNHKIAVHTHIKPYTCEICNKGFKGLRSLKSHGLIHTGSKPYTCDICKRQFRHESALRVHNRIHTGVKPYSCPICKQQFRRTGGVKAHIIHMHTEEKPFSCEICKKQFATKGSLKFHVGTHAKDES